MPLRVNQELSPGTDLKTGADSQIFLQVNGVTSTVEMTESTEMTLTKMLEMGSFFSPDTSTELKLDGGTVLGNVKKISANSDYKVTVPNGVAGIRGTSFEVTVTVDNNGGLTIRFTSAKGDVFCQVSVPPGTLGQTSQTLHTGDTWVVTGTIARGITTLNSPTTLPPAALGIIVLDIEHMLQVVGTAIVTTTPNGTVNTTTIVPPNTSASQTGGSNAPPRSL